MSSGSLTVDLGRDVDKNVVWQIVILLAGSLVQNLLKCEIKNRNPMGLEADLYIYMVIV